jgi:hypothetical protein
MQFSSRDGTSCHEVVKTECKLLVTPKIGGKMKLKTTSLLVALLSFAGSSLAGIGTITGREAQGWQTGYYNVIVARIGEIRAVQGHAGQYRAVLQPLASIAGRADPSEQPRIEVRFEAGDRGVAVTSISTTPPENSIVLAVVHLNVLYADEAVRSNWIAADFCKFMPGDAGMVVIKGLDDPRVLEPLRKIQDARAHPNPSPYPATRPNATGMTTKHSNDRNRP